MPDETVWRTMLFDFYGELLTEKQREYFDLHYNSDLSLAEIAEASGISRQGVWDIIRRAQAILRETEAKTGLVARFQAQREILHGVEGKLAALERITDGEAQSLTKEVIQRLGELSQA